MIVAYYLLARLDIWPVLELTVGMPSFDQTFIIEKSEEKDCSSCHSE